ncbi:hypothetical protein [Azotosporobacter soli]|uniref:hypothetical protein n=1 Tax=Azotosporobacter soli TaxID=3055040 RepID=UPI0031FE82D9
MTDLELRHKLERYLEAPITDDTDIVFASLQIDLLDTEDLQVKTLLLAMAVSRKIGRLDCEDRFSETPTIIIQASDFKNKASLPRELDYLIRSHLPSGSQYSVGSNLRDEDGGPLFRADPEAKTN